MVEAEEVVIGERHVIYVAMEVLRVAPGFLAYAQTSFNGKFIILYRQNSCRNVLRNDGNSSRWLLNYATY